MKRQTKHIIGIVLVAFSLYYWVLIPLLRVCLTPFLGQDTAESIAMSCALFKKINVFYSLNIPSDSFGRMMYYINRGMELIAFVFSYFSFALIKSSRKPIATFYIGTVIAGLVFLAAFNVRGTFGGTVLPLIAFLSALSLWRVYLETDSHHQKSPASTDGPNRSRLV